MAGPRYLFDCWDEVADRIHRSRSLALFLDFDGTLVRLRRRPEKVTLSEATRRQLKRIALHRRVTVSVISGRRRRDLSRRMRVPGARYLGLHGWERENTRVPRPAARDRKALREARRRIVAALRALPGIWVEDKLVGLAVHARNASRESARRAGAAVRRVVRSLGPGLRLLAGKSGWEILPRAVEGKGAAVRELLSELPGRSLAICLGDDASDEAAFRALRREITVRVGPSRKTRARYFLRRPSEVARFLEKLEGEIA